MSRVSRTWISGGALVAAALALHAFSFAAQPADTHAVSRARAGPPAFEPVSLRTVPFVDLKRYYGRWYEIARYPNFFQSGLVGVTAEYSPRSDGRIDVVNTGRKRRLDGPEKRSEAVAWVVCRETNSKLAVQFFAPFKADYWIIDLADDYSYAVVGQPSRDYLWILARQPTLPDEVYQTICERLRRQGYDPDKLERTPQPPRS